MSTEYGKYRADTEEYYIFCGHLYEPYIFQCAAVCCSVLRCCTVYAASIQPAPAAAEQMQVSFHKRATNYRALMQKMTYDDQACNASLPPCMPPSSSPPLLL